MDAIGAPSGLARFAGLYCAASRLIDKLQPLLLLGFRLYVAKVFWMSGLTKTRDWSVTLALFTDEYHVPLLSPAVAAVVWVVAGVVCAVGWPGSVANPWWPGFVGETRVEGERVFAVL